MAPGDTLVGRRIPVPANGKLPYAKIKRPGDYCGPIFGYTGPKTAVYFLKPNARDDDAPPRARSLQHVTIPPHSVTEEDDGTLTIAPSIGDTVRGGAGDSDGWHGFLEHGVWRQV